MIAVIKGDGEGGLRETDLIHARNQGYDMGDGLEKDWRSTNCHLTERAYVTATGTIEFHRTRNAPK